MTTDIPSFESCLVTDAPEQVQSKDKGTSLCVLTPPTPLATAATAVEFVQRHRTLIDQALQDYGVVLFRGFPLTTADDFDAFVQAWEDWHDLSYDRSMSFAVRKRMANRICTTNEGKSGGLVFHHEQAQTPLWPSHVFFCCLKPANPGDGGATGLVNSHVVYQTLLQEFPDFVQACETHGVRYTVYAGPHQDTSKGAGRSWKSFFHVTTKDECETKLQAGGWDYEWGVGPNGTKRADDYLKCTTPVLDAVKVAPGTTRKCFFNQLIATVANALEFSRDSGGYDPLKDVPTQDGIDACVQFGNGDTVPLPVLLRAKDICEAHAVNVQWQQGDVALLSNYLVMHARRPWQGPEGSRQLLASLVAEEHCTSFGKPLVAL